MSSTNGYFKFFKLISIFFKFRKHSNFRISQFLKALKFNYILLFNY